eukprot:4244839-Pleurochrysis_carterae.AAC.6
MKSSLVLGLAAYGVAQQTHYGLVFDAGSSGSRVHVYEWRSGVGGPKDAFDLNRVTVSVDRSQYSTMLSHIRAHAACTGGVEEAAPCIATMDAGSGHCESLLSSRRAFHLSRLPQKMECGRDCIDCRHAESGRPPLLCQTRLSVTRRKSLVSPPSNWSRRRLEVHYDRYLNTRRPR